MNETYQEQMARDILDVLRDYTESDFYGMDRDQIADKLFDDFILDDIITGNASGSYFFSWSAAREMVLNNYDYVPEIADVYGHETIGEQLINGEWESLDVEIRCYLLPGMIDEILDGIDFESGDAASELIQLGA